MLKSMSRFTFIPLAAVGLFLAGTACEAAVEEPTAEVATATQTEEATGQDDETKEDDAKYAEFEKLLTGVKMVGSFTIKDKEGRAPQVEEYEIAECKRVGKTDTFSVKARIKYGDKDYDWPPIAVEVKWAGDTPMITLTDRSFFGVGPFSARVLFHDEMYAGTWAHGKVGGHMYGRLIKADEADQEGDQKADKN